MAHQNLTIGSSQILSCQYLIRHVCEVFESSTDHESPDLNGPGLNLSLNLARSYIFFPSSRHLTSLSRLLDKSDTLHKNLRATQFLVSFHCTGYIYSSALILIDRRTEQAVCSLCMMLKLKYLHELKDKNMLSDEYTSIVVFCFFASKAYLPCALFITR